MRLFLSLIIFSGIALVARSQHVEETYPKTLWCPNDTFALKFENNPNISYFTVSRRDKGSPGTNAGPNAYVMLYYGYDSLRLQYHNKLPYAHIIYINFESPKGKTTLRFHFNDLANFFPADYMARNKGNAQIDIPEVYELANIIWTLSPAGSKAKDLNKAGKYYDRVKAHFKPYLDHPLFKALDFPDSMYTLKYYDFRENSFAFNFRKPSSGVTDTRLLFNGPYYYVWGSELADSSLFGKLKPLVEDFAAKSKFRQFYKSNRSYYQKQIQRQKELLPVAKMWRWLEEQFPDTRCQSYRIVFSPLIGSFHSTQGYGTYANKTFFRENVMFICGTDRYDTISTYSEKQKEGLMSGVVFTEIDHNYVNPATDHYAKVVDSIFSHRNIWAKTGNNSGHYNNGVSVFNEYMTHAVFCLYVAEVYDKTAADFIIDYREQLMVDKRNFIRFKEFNRALLKFRQEHKDLKVVELYPFVLDWCRQQG